MYNKYIMNYNKTPLYEDLCVDIIHDCIVFVDTLNIQLAKNQILINCVDVNINSYILNFVPYKSRLELNIPLLQYNICKKIYSLLDQFYKLNENGEYCVINYDLATHEDATDLVIKMSTILSNRLLGKNIIDRNIIAVSLKPHIDTYDHVVALMEYF
jgi:hypothetical protein